MTRALPMEGIANIRDLGGLPAGAHRLAAGRLIRSGSLGEMTDTDRRSLESRGVQTVIDLRSDWEREQRPTTWPRASIVAAPLVASDLAAAITQGVEAGAVASEELEDWWTLTGVYTAPFDHLASIRTIFDVLLALPADQGALFHCRTGKDRTGLVAAIILEALGVDRSDILDDFLLTNPELAAARTRDAEALERLADHLRLSPAAVAALSGVNPVWLETLFAGIEARAGSVLRYIAEVVGIGEDGITELRARYLV